MSQSWHLFCIKTPLLSASALDCHVSLAGIYKSRFTLYGCPVFTHACAWTSEKQRWRYRPRAMWEEKGLCCQIPCLESNSPSSSFSPLGSTQESSIGPFNKLFHFSLILDHLIWEVNFRVGRCKKTSVIPVFWFSTQCLINSLSTSYNVSDHVPLPPPFFLLTRPRYIPPLTSRSRFRFVLTVCAAHIILGVGLDTKAWTIYQGPHNLKKNWFSFF